uniref:E2 ubiquitin-conjugating enzyme n=1 Tax=Panagrolaimus sp. PS1159 TaxID=55785 RepID=A0AC35FRF4_9BILA
MSDPSTVRIKNEIKEILRSNCLEEIGCSIEPNPSDFHQVNAMIMGPPDSPYADGVFHLAVKFPREYPFKPPDVKFLTNVWHPNISSVTGVICLDILKDRWAASLSLRTILISIRALLSDPVPDDPQDAVVAKQFIVNKHMFEKTAAIWTHMFAGGPENSVDEDYNNRLNKLEEIGVGRKEALRFLSNSNWNVEKSIEAAYD